MKRFLILALAASMGLIYGGTASAFTGGGTAGPGTVQEGTYYKVQDSVAAYTTGTPANGIQASRHNLGSLGTLVTNTGAPKTGNGYSGANVAGTSEICVFCHTPHHSISTASAAVVDGSNASYTPSYAPAPLWNRETMSTTFIGYGSTISGTNPTGTPLQIGGVSLACLSCHDGTTTFDNLVNAPGEGMGASATYGAAAVQGFTYADAGNPLGATAIAKNLSQEPFLAIGYGPAGLTAGVANLSNDHPMSITYNSAKASLRPTSTVIANIDLAGGLLFTAAWPEYQANLGQNRWAIGGYINDTATIADLLRNGKVECSSCHDPHFKNMSNIDMDNTFVENPLSITKSDGLFLRRVGGNAASGVCRTCHNK